jgi:predicted Zn-dependent protease
MQWLASLRRRAMLRHSDAIGGCAVTSNYSASGAPGRQFEHELREIARLLPTEPEAALERARSIAAERPAPRAFRLAAEACRILGRRGEAEQAELNAIRFGLAPPLNQAVEARQSGRAIESKTLAEQYLRHHPDDMLARTILAEAYASLRKYIDAEQILRTVVERAPAFPRASILLAQCLAEQLRMREAIAAVGALLKRAPSEPAALRYLADLRAQTGDYAEACDLYGRLLSADPDDRELSIRLAQTVRVAGRRSESLEMLRKIVDRFPDAGTAWWTLAYYFPEGLDDSDVARIRESLGRNDLSPSDAQLLKIALSIVHDRQGEHEEAFNLLAEVKRLRALEHPYDPERISAQVDRAIAEFTPQLFERRSADGDPDGSAIFIVGMPRSGSTLTERIFGRHSEIEAAGELQVMPHLVDALEEHRRAAGDSAGPTSLPADLTRMAQWYLESAREFRRTDKPRFVDKFNSNWLNAGLIRLMLPNARIIDVRRDALDCCWSAYKTLGDAFTNDQRHLARYYRDYVRFMEAIDAASPGGIITVRYEDLVTDLEGQTRRMLDFLGLDYEPACLDFHLSTDAVATPSSEQVRRPVNRDSIGSASAYRQFLGPLIEELGELAN